MIRTYCELSHITTFDERFKYLRLNGKVGADTFGFDRYLNQMLYSSTEWKTIRDKVIARDNGCDMSMMGHDICGPIIVHHMNPISISDVISKEQSLFNLDFLVCVSRTTHNAIHYGDEKQLTSDTPDRHMFDTCPWKK